MGLGDLTAEKGAEAIGRFKKIFVRFGAADTMAAIVFE